MKHSIVYLIPKTGGPPPNIAFPRLRAHGNLHALFLEEPSAALLRDLGKWCKSFKVLKQEEHCLESIVSFAQKVNADAIVAFSETAIAAASLASSELNLGGAGANVVYSRDKVRMREVWRDAGVNVPAFAAVRSWSDLQRADRLLRRPFLLKPAWLAGSLGQGLVAEDVDLGEVWREVAHFVSEIELASKGELLPQGGGVQFIAEEIIDASTESWYPVEGYGDYLSVEGLVASGRYHPICISARLPTIPPFVETSAQLPTVLSEEAQRVIEKEARRAVDALGLDSCLTHTELKLQKNGRVCFLESAARVGGGMIPLLAQETFEIDLIDLLVRVLLDKKVELPERMLTRSSSSTAAASLFVIAADWYGRPWKSRPPFQPDLVDWSRLVSPGSQVEVVHSIPTGTPVPEFSPTAGALNFAATLVIRARDPHTLRGDCYQIANGLHDELCRVAHVHSST